MSKVSGGVFQHDVFRNGEVFGVNGATLNYGKITNFLCIFWKFRPFFYAEAKKSNNLTQFSLKNAKRSYKNGEDFEVNGCA